MVSSQYIQAERHKANSLINKNHPDKARLIYAGLADRMYSENRLQDALQDYLQAIQLGAGNAIIFDRVGTIFRKLGRYMESEQAYKKAVAFDSSYKMASLNLAVLLQDQSRFDEALTCIKRALRYHADDVDTNKLLGNLMLGQGNYDEAIKHFNSTIDLLANPADSYARIAYAHEHSGNIEEAVANIEKSFEYKGSDLPFAATTFAEISGHVGRESEAIAILSRLVDMNLSPRERVDIHFSLAKVLDSINEYEQAFAHYRRGNNLSGIQFNPLVIKATGDAITGAYHADRLADLARSSIDTSNLIFIVGMPRSGTSLVEQILDAHPDVFGAGERNDISRLAMTLPTELAGQQPYPACISSLDEATCNKLASQHLDRVKEIAGGAHYIVDKTPGNFAHLGLIALLFPAAKVIHCVRNPLDTCLSCYFQKFGPKLPFTAKLEHLGFAYKEYQRLMDHWCEVLSLDVYQFQYEELVAAPEVASKKLVSFCGIDWDDQCLRFYNSGRTCTTASYNQVRKPIYTSSVGRWKQYEPFISPLKDVLGLDH